MPETWTPGLIAIVGFSVGWYGFTKMALPGGGILAGSILAVALGPAAGSGFALPLLILGDLLALSRYRRNASWSLIVRVLPGVVVGLLATAVLFSVLDRSQLSRLLGVMIMISVVLEVRRRRLGDAVLQSNSALSQRVSVGFFGVLAGMTTMAANAGGAAMSLYLLKARVPMLTFLGTSTWFFFIVNVAKLPISVPLGLITVDTLKINLAFLPLLLVGAGIGVIVVRRMSQEFFAMAVLVLSAMAAAWLIIHG